MKGYNTVEELSLQQSYEILQKEENNPYIEQVRLHYGRELEKRQAEEKHDFEACQSLREYEQFIAKYQAYASFYTMQYKKAALDKIEALFWNANSSSIKKCSLYIEKYPRGKYVDEARKKIESIKRKKRIIITIILVLLAVICFIAYKPAGDISVSSESVSFSKYGGANNISVITKANEYNVDVSANVSWIKTNIEGKSLQLKAEENPDDNKSGEVTIVAYSTFFGERVSAVTKTISISQESGLPTDLNVSPKNLSYDKYGSPENSSEFIIKTDGIGYSVSCPASYVHIKENIKSPSQSPREIEVKVSVDKNDSEYRTAAITIKSGQYTKIVNISQASGAASFLSINKDRIKADKEGAGEGFCYRVAVSTDGVSWKANPSAGWILTSQYNNTLDITVTPNNGDVRTGYVYVNSNNGHTETVTIEQDGNPTIFKFSKSSHTFDTDADYEYFTITNNSNQPVSCNTSSNSWLHPSIVNGELKVRCDRNDNSPRDGIVYIKCGDKDANITIYQKGWKPCSNCNGSGYVRRMVYRQGQFMGFSPMGNPIYGPSYPDVETTVCSHCKNSGKKGYIKTK